MDSINLLPWPVLPDAFTITMIINFVILVIIETFYPPRNSFTIKYGIFILIIITVTIKMNNVNNNNNNNNNYITTTAATTTTTTPSFANPSSSVRSTFIVENQSLLNNTFIPSAPPIYSKLIYEKIIFII